MKSYKVQHKNLEQMIFPELCPHCLSDTAKSHIRIATHNTMPGAVSLKYQEWPVCERCSDYFRKAKRKTGLHILSSFGLLLIVVVIVFYLMISTDIINMTFAFAIPFFLVIACIVYSQLAKSRLATSMGVPFAKPPITIYRIGKQAFGKGNFVEFTCHHKEYASSYLEANSRNGSISSKPKIEPNA